ncbi:tRNA (adenosine(37)-N6)-threonylcarbamoyltransferase complex dimerization subunit type 1 TsaB [Phenylobacterium sp.]|uniref:tRNA (adenosine(37)-N6)-threonylcarbamoyltransferase complex dimerization subunit type 1 TsaB n=1 Tax=Phenylobacterium sp. TaxID=1871053 RepID=UPI002737E119|nr:tRNA (adenosine(37)-N6)-threonylcarbamoyltransferase complex dimerization subunit type 1 TsaB [Phenylobacterium sp.]MDP3870654.1 tRNA (adenosine(37)-N6)-threonylcarbamoyltransferase complex dimerization subunit type 1 TsaB [Phenylobacterium sp.]
MLLAIDTCLGACSAAVLDGGRVLASRVEPMARGHQERLAPLVAQVMTQAGVAFDQLDRVGVTIGPGSFTGLRVGLAFAKGLGAALSIPVVGVGVLEALAHPLSGTVFAVLDAKRDQVYLQAFADGVAVSAPDALPPGTAAARLAELAGAGNVTLVGSGAPLLAGALPHAAVVAADHADPVAVAQIAADRLPVPPRPLDRRGPDAKLPGGRDLPA